jgi:hypothetical protein
VGGHMFVLVRYLGTIAMITSAVGYYGRGYSSEFCDSYQRVAPLMKVFSGIANQAVFLWRAYAISQRQRWVLMTLSAAWIIAAALQFFANATTVPAQNSMLNCIAAAKPGFRVSWIYYLAAMLYDFLVLGISHYYLSGTTGLSWSEMYTFTRTLAKQGIAYVMLATLMNVVNLIFFQLPVATAVQGMFATTGIAITALASQRILLALLDPHARLANPSTGNPYSDSGRSRSLSGMPFSRYPPRADGSRHDPHIELDPVQVHISVQKEDSDGHMVSFDGSRRKKGGAEDLA